MEIARLLFVSDVIKDSGFDTRTLFAPLTGSFTKYLYAASIVMRMAERVFPKMARE
jgi:hypothetical protein